MPLLPPACPMTETAVWQQSAWSKVSNHPYYQSKPPTWAAQFLCWKIQIIPCEFAFLSCQRHTIYILCIHDTCNQWWDCYTSFDKRRYFVGSYHSPAFRTAVYISRDLGDCRAKDVEEMNGHFLMFNKKYYLNQCKSFSSPQKPTTKWVTRTLITKSDIIIPAIIRIGQRNVKYDNLFSI